MDDGNKKYKRITAQLVKTLIKTRTGPKNKNKNAAKKPVYKPNGAVKKSKQIPHWAGFGTRINNGGENKNNNVNLALNNCKFALNF